MTFHQSRPNERGATDVFSVLATLLLLTEMPLETVNRGAASQQSLFNGILTPAAGELVCRSCVKESVASRPLIADLSRDHDHTAAASEP